jgi:hypothetical protein
LHVRNRVHYTHKIKAIDTLRAMPR